MIWYIIIGCILFAIVFICVGWTARKWKDEFDHDIEKAFEEALRNNE